MIMNAALPLSIVLPVLVLFSIDPYTSLVADNNYKQNYRDIATSDDGLNKDKGNNKNSEHLSRNVQDLALAQGIKDSLVQAGFDTIGSILKESPSDISNKLGIEMYVAQIIKEAAKSAMEGNSEKETK